MVIIFSEGFEESSLLDQKIRMKLFSKCTSYDLCHVNFNYDNIYVCSIAIPDEPSYSEILRTESLHRESSVTSRFSSKRPYLRSSSYSGMMIGQCRLYIVYLL